MWRLHVQHAPSSSEDWGSDMQRRTGRKSRIAGAQGWNMGVRDASLSFPESAAALDRLIEERVEGELKARAALRSATVHSRDASLARATGKACRSSHAKACWQEGLAWEALLLWALRVK